MIFTDDFSDYLDISTWLAEIGDTWVCVPHETDGGDSELLVLFEGGYKVDFVFFVGEELSRMVRLQSINGVDRRGYYILLDKDGLADRLPSPSFSALPSSRPDEETYLRLVDTFWYGAVYVAKQIRRRELWIAKYRDWTMKELLLTMMAWHAQANHGPTYDTWHDGRFLLEWVDTQTQRDLYHVFGRFEATDSWQALLATMNLFRRLARKTAELWDYAYPVKLEERTIHFVIDLFASDHDV